MTRGRPRPPIASRSSASTRRTCLSTTTSTSTTSLLEPGASRAPTSASSHPGLETNDGRPRAIEGQPKRASRPLKREDKSPTRRLGGIDNRGSHFYLALFWAEALTSQTADPSLAQEFASLASKLRAQEETIVEELIAVQGQPVDIGGYYRPDPAKCEAAMRPSATFNQTLKSWS